MTEEKQKEQNDEIYFRHGELRQLVLSGVGLGILLGGTFLVTPNFPIVFGTLLSLIKGLTDKKVPENKIKRVLKNLAEKEILQLEEKEDEVYVYLKGKWRPLILRYSLKPLLELKKRKKKWTGKWFLVVFDVPEQQRNKRNYLRKFLRDIGFYPYQQSVYIFPFECKKEVELIKKIVEGGRYISYIIADEIENEEKVKRFFGLPT